MLGNDEMSSMIRRIIEGALGDLARWQRPGSLPSVGPAFPEVFDRFERDLSQLRAEIADRLALWSIRELSEIAPKSEAAKVNPLFDEHGRLGTLAITLRRLKSRVPQDFVGGWSVVGKEVDLPYWSSFATVSLEDLTFLSLGREPRKASLSAACESYGRSEEGDALLYFLEDRLELIANAMGCNPGDSKARVDLRAFFDWVEETRLPIDSAFQQALRSRFQPETLAASIEAPKRLSEDIVGTTKFDPRERATLTKLVFAMAVDGYGYNPEELRGPIPKQIEDAVLFLGMEVTTNTIRKYLREGRQYLPEGWSRNSSSSLKK